MEYSREQIRKALITLGKLKSAKKTMELLGYPGKMTLLKWEHNVEKYLTPEELEDYAYVMRIRCASKELIKEQLLTGNSLREIAEITGYSYNTITRWRKIIETEEGYVFHLKRSKQKKEAYISKNEYDALKAQMQEMQMEMDILKETINVLKKDPGVDSTALRSSEKTVIVVALKAKYSLSNLLEKLKLPRSSYYYNLSAQKKRELDKDYQRLSDKIQELFQTNRCSYGYRRIHGLLKQKGIRVSEKVVRKIMRDNNLIVTGKKKRKYNSYVGEISPEVPNIIQRDFSSDMPNKKWLTDITEFSIPAGKIYLSPIIDCFDGMPVTWTISESPNAELVNTMLDSALQVLLPNEKPIIHSDRGCHYRWPGWIERMETAGLTRSMSKKGCSPDNAACEGFFGRLKNEMFYGKSWKGVTVIDFMKEVNDYIIWYKEKRIKMSLGGMSPLDYRRSLGLAV